MDVPRPVNYPMKGILQNIDKNSIRLPDFQRDFRWKLSDISELLISMLRGFPIGTFLFWEIKENNDSIPSRAFDKVDKEKWGNSQVRALVLDGQQRLSSLYQLFYCESTKPKDRSETKFFLKIQELLNGNIDESIDYYTLEKVKHDNLDDKIIQIKNKLLPLNILLFDDKLEEWKLSYAYFYASLMDDVDKAKAENEILKNLNSSLFYDNMPVKNLIDFQFNVIELSSNIGLETVATIFEKLNSTGAPLDIFEILTAKFHNKLKVNLNNNFQITLRGLWEETVNLYHNLKDYKEKMKGNILPQLILKSILLNKGSEIKRKNLLETLAKDDIDKYWIEIVKSFDLAIEELKNNYGCPNVDYLPYTTMLVPFSLALHKVSELPEDKQKEAKRKIEKWYWYSVFTQRYDSATDSKSKMDFDQLIKWINDDEPMQVMSTTKLNIKDLNLVEAASTGALFTGIMNLILKKGAKDFETSKPLIEIPTDIDVHHLYPRKQFQTKEEEEKADSLLNKTLMKSETNRTVIRDQMPKTYIDYFKTHGNPDILEQLRDHFIPEKEFLSGSLNDFDEFLNKREKLFKEEIERLVYGDFNFNNESFD
jgi:hypothetical protein